tara:strand:+ start:399 stop:683 length:285 start_codon:yes stop_codon:yes gene_type:complete
MLKTLKKISKEAHPKYIQYKLDNIYSVDKDHNNIKELLKNIEFNKQTRFFISKTLEIDSINIVDIDNIKFIEFENDLYEFTNKGLDNNYELFLN